MKQEKQQSVLADTNPTKLAISKSSNWWAKHLRFGRKTAIFIGILAIASAISTYFVFQHSDSTVGPDPTQVITLVIINIALMILLAVFITHRAFNLWSQLRSGTIGSKLQKRVLTVFIIVAITPTLIIALFSAYFFNYGISAWFDERVSSALDNSVQVAEAYLREHKATIRADAAAMSGLLSRELPSIITSPIYFNNLLNSQATIRSLTEAVIIQNKQVLARSKFSFSIIFDELSDGFLERAKQGDIIIIDNKDRISALAPIDPASNTFLLISRMIDSNVLDYAADTEGAAEQYHRLRDRISELQTTFTIVFILITILLLLAVIWYGMIFVSGLVVPISSLVKATEHVRAGDYSIRVATPKKQDEIRTLIEQFNRMTEQLAAQRDDLTQSNRMMNERRRLTEAVLEGASAGVVATNPLLEITLYNGQALQLLHIDRAEDIVNLLHAPIEDIIPEIIPLLEYASEAPEELHQDNITLSRNQKNLTLHVRISAQMTGSRVEGFIITFDDISPLVSAQRSAAWSDVARRIAHEIKNPLTPIQLSAERIRKKYKPDSEKETEPFNRYIDTIVKHSRDIGVMIDEFSSFARMPTPVFKMENIAGIIKKSVFSTQTAFEGVSFSHNITSPDAQLNCDERQISQVMSNLLKNAAESLERRPDKDGEKPVKGEVNVTAGTVRGHYIITIKDNGVGFPPALMDKIMEPYVTTRKKGTGLGLAIVKKTVEDHKGTVEIANLDEGGAVITLRFPIG